MSELYSVHVVRVQDDEVDLDVSVVHPDAGDVPEDKCFALRVLWDPINGYQYGREPAVQSSPLAREMDLDAYLDESFIHQNAQGFIQEVRYISEENHPPPSCGEPGYEEFWDSDLRASAVIRIKVTHPGWLSHMRVGMSWDTAAYGSGDGASWRDRPKRTPGDYIEQISDDPMQGMTQGYVTDKNLRMFEHAQVTQYILPLFGAKQYTTKGQELRGEQLTPAQLEPLLGLPVLVQTRYRLEIGALIGINHDGGWISIYHEAQGGGSYGTHGASLNEIEYIGRAWHVARISVHEVEV